MNVVERYSNTAATTAAVANRLVASANMKVGTYTVANGGVAVWSGGFKVSITHTQVGGVTDTLGTVVFVGTDLNGSALTETVTPIDSDVALGTKIFKAVTTITGVGWVIDTTADTIVVGVQAGNFVMGSGGILGTVTVNNTVAAAIVISDSRGTIATIPASQAAGSFFSYWLVCSGFLKVATTSTNDVTVTHTNTAAAFLNG